MYKQDVIDVLRRQCSAPRWHCTACSTEWSFAGSAAWICWNGKQLSRQCPQLWKLFLFLPPGEHILIRKHSTLQVAGDLIRVYRSGVITKQIIVLLGRNKLGNHKIYMTNLKMYVCRKSVRPGKLLARPVFWHQNVRPGLARPIRAGPTGHPARADLC